MRPLAAILFAAGTVFLLSACSAQQGYASAQSWKRNQCGQIMDAQERIRCLREADASYDSYKKETDELKAPR